MVTKLQQLGDLMLRKVTPPITAKADPVYSCSNEYCCCLGGCPFSQKKIKYDRICNGVYQYSWYASCGSCA